MHPSLESFSTELFFEIFEYLSLIDRFRAFAGLNRRLTLMVNLHPVRVNLQSISRWDFDFLCRHIRPERVISLVFSEEKMPDQVKLFLEHFPDFEHQFICLQSVKLIQTENCLSILPRCVSCLTFSKMFCGNGVNEMLIQQAKILTHLNVDKLRLIQSVNIEFPLLTHLTIDSFCFIDQVDQLIQNFKTPPIFSLNVSFAGDHDHFPFKFEKMCWSLMYLKHLTIKLVTGRRA
ncbi:unnamed protein product [Didymodactylos carnosus]|uniref:F-box domain-containing protein n=1 Tax=Didymodactylos carnosus TaxID=1234261 RepID=A0A814MWW2_9BILA|nr:unnamed protein product [Didymodactylos carnosus]CAF3850417.1 unnamed protein product [Didymodactylos carnosus]